jgi:hypothetical protein
MGEHWVRDLINDLVDMLGCTRMQAKRIILAARREGYLR